MKLSLSWIRDYVNIPEDADLKKLAYDLTMSTVEVEDVEYLAERFENMIVGVIEKIEPHPNADRLRVCKVNIGSDEIKDIVCGGINLEEGMRVAVSCRGAVVRWHGEGEPVVIKNSKLRGVESFGMICASDEIGLGELFPSETEGEILDLSAFDVPAGTSLADALDMMDVDSPLIRYSLSGEIANANASISLSWAKDGDEKLYILGGAPQAGFVVLEVPKKVKETQ